MHSSMILGALAVMAGGAAAKIIQINVGQGGFNFSPSSSTADVGDTLEFHFFSSLHTVVEGDFSTPCSRGSLEKTGFNSGPVNNMPNGGPSVFQVPVTSTDPIWFYCSTPSHCQGGMAGVVNPPSSGPNTLDAYMTAAEGTSSSEGSTTVQGGSLVPEGTQPSSVAGSSSAAPATSSASSVASAVSSTESSVASSASSAVSSASSVASSASSAAAGGSSTTAPSGSGSSSTSPSATPSSSSTSGASGIQGSIIKAQGLWAFVAAALGLAVFFMA